MAWCWQRDRRRAVTEDPKPVVAPPTEAPPAEALAAPATQAAAPAGAAPPTPRRAAARPGLAGAALAAIGNVVAWIFAFVVAAGILACGGVGVLVYQVSQNLPDHAHLADLQPAVMTRVHAGDGRVFAEYAIERRIFVPLDAIPARLAEAFVSAEDKTFWTHPGISVPDIVRAAATNAQNWGKKRPVGASTITQQVAKNLLLSNEVSIERKIKEALLSIRLEETLPKQRILELYLNQIYLGFQAYGVASAGLMYFGKSLEDLELHEVAFLAALPKAPNNYNPQRFPERARDRRDWVLGRMLEDGKVTQAEHDAARARPLVVRNRAEAVDTARADYFAEEVRRELLARFGEDSLYRGGLSVRTSLDPELQRAVDAALRQGLVEYDRRHGWRGPVAQVELGAGWEGRLAQLRVPGLGNWQVALVHAIAPDRAEIGFADGTRGIVPLEEMRWAGRTLEEQKVGPRPRTPADVVRPGDAIVVEAVVPAAGAAPPPAGAPRRFALRQVPDVGGAVVALDPHTGRVLAMAGGWSFEASQFNRATQAQRQPGSAFKPFIYLSALEAGVQPNSIILDAPVVVDQGPDQDAWKPGNYGGAGVFHGPTTLRSGLERSLNLMTVRLAMYTGVERMAAIARDFGISERMPPVPSAALGSVETTVLRLTTAYASFANGGMRVTPTLVDRVQDRTGRTIYRSDTRECAQCRDEAWRGQQMPTLPDPRRRITDEFSAYQMVSILEGAIERGTGVRARVPGRMLAGKTGTTNDSVDAWFVGFSPELVVGVWVGFDNPRTLGARETGGAAAVPIFHQVMLHATRGRAASSFRVPHEMTFATVDPKTGLPAEKGITEAFKPDQDPEAPTVPGALGGSAGSAQRSVPMPVPASPGAGASSSGGGIY
ncbi:MAG: Penicillin-binding protein [Pseudomonadota bacterium]